MSVTISLISQHFGHYEVEFFRDDICNATHSYRTQTFALEAARLFLITGHIHTEEELP